MRTIASAVLAIALAALAWAAYSTYASDQALRGAAMEFAERYTMPLRRPDVVASLQFAPSADFATDLVADATLRDLTIPVRLTGLSPAERIAWLDSAGHIDEQAARAADLVIDAMAQRPGWPYHAALLGQIVYASQERTLSPSLLSQPARWSVPLRVGTKGSPQDPLLWQFTAIAYLQTWSSLASQHRYTAPFVFRRAFEDVDFVRHAVTSATQIVGGEMVLAALPESPKALWAAFDQLGRSGEMMLAWRVHQRWDAVEWKRRQIDLAAIDRASSRGDVDAVRHLCEAWARNHSVWDYDSAAAHAQAARLLELWPVSDRGEWPNDARAEAMRYFLSGRRNDVNSVALARAADGISGVPAPVEAQLRVLAADVTGAEAIAKRSDSFGSLEWKSYLFELSRYWLRKGDPDKAREALTRLPAAANAECEAVTARAAAGATDPAAPAPVRLMWTTRADVPVCFPRDAAAKLTLTLLSDAPVVVDFGWDRARAGSVLLSQKGQPVDVDLERNDGFRLISVRSACPMSGTSIALDVTPIISGNDRR